MSLPAVKFNSGFTAPKPKLNFDTRENVRKRPNLTLILSSSSSDDEEKSEKKDEKEDLIRTRRDSYEGIRITQSVPDFQNIQAMNINNDDDITISNNAPKTPTHPKNGRFQGRPRRPYPKRPEIRPQMSQGSPLQINLNDEKIENNQSNADERSQEELLDNESQSSNAVHISSDERNDQVPLQLNEKGMVVYKFEKYVKSKLPKKKVNLSLIKDGKPILSLSYDGNTKDIVFQGIKAQFCLLIGNNMTSFSLRKENKYGDEILGIHILKKKKPLYRTFIFFLFYDINNYLRRNENQVPKNTNNFKSVKNLLFCTKDNQELLTVNRVSKTIFEIEALPGLTEEMLFTIAIAAAIAKR